MANTKLKTRNTTLIIIIIKKQNLGLQILENRTWDFKNIILTPYNQHREDVAVLLFLCNSCLNNALLCIAYRMAAIITSCLERMA